MKNLDAVYAEKIAAEYTVKPASKLVALKKLDRRARPGGGTFRLYFRDCRRTDPRNRNVPVYGRNR